MELISRLQHEGKAIIAIHTGMNPRSFAQSSMPKLQSQEGVLLSPEGETSTWLLEGTRCITEGTREHMEFWGPDFEGESLLDIIKGKPENAWNILHYAISSINKAIISETLEPSFITALGSAGPMAIFYGKDKTLLLLPGELCARCASNHGEEKEIEHRLSWIHPDHRLHNPMRAISFMAGICAYRILSENMPFESDDAENKGESLSEKMRNGVFEDLLFAKGSLKPAAAQAVNSLITAKSAASTETLLAFGSDISVLYDPARANIEETDTFRAQKKAAKTKRESNFKRKRFFRKRSSILIIIGVFTVIVAIFGLTFHSDIKNKPSTIGLNTYEVVNRYYKGIEDLDQEISTTFAVKGLKTDYDTFITNLYVTSKMREAYERNGGILSPAELYATKKTNNRMIYGITQLNIEKLIQTESESLFTVSFYMWMPYAEEQTDESAQLSIFAYEDSVSLKWLQDRWLISGIKPEKRLTLVKNGKNLLDDIIEGNGDEYPWAPSIQEVQDILEQFIME